MDECGEQRVDRSRALAHRHRTTLRTSARRATAFPRSGEVRTSAPHAPRHAGTLTRMAYPEQSTAHEQGIGEVIARLRALSTGWPPDDGVAVFNRVYLSVTEAVAQRVEKGRLGDRADAVTLDVCFAGRYLAAIAADAADQRPPACWRPLFRYRHRPGIHPLQFALAGINAHIGHDLGLAVVDACQALDCTPDELEDEFDRVGDLLVTLEERIREEVMPGPDLLQVADPLTHLLGCWSLERARDGAWSAARALWALRHTPALADDLAGRLDAAVGLIGRMLLTPLPLPHRHPPVPAPAPAD